MQKEILNKYPEAEIQVYSIWLPMLLPDKFSRKGAGELTDIRVKHYWDEEKIVGKWYAQQWGYENVVAWDVYFLYGKEAVWDSLPGPLLSWGYPVIEAKEKLQQDIQALLGK